MSRPILVLYLLSLFACNGEKNQLDQLPFEDMYELPGIPSESTITIINDTIYYASMDDPDVETLKSYSLITRNLLWSVTLPNSSINRGGISSNREYVIPTLSDSILLVDSSGKVRYLKITYRCKINPIVYKNSFIIQDRGIGIISFEASTLKKKWEIPQASFNTMSQPLLIDTNLLFILDDNTLYSVGAETGKENWKTSLDSFSVNDIYGESPERIYLISKLSNNKLKLTCINYKDGSMIWVNESKIINDIDFFQRSMVVKGDTLFCRGQHDVLVIDILTGNSLPTLKIPGGISTNLILDKRNNLYFGLNNNSVAIYSPNGETKVFKPLKDKLNMLYRSNTSIYLYSYPAFYRLKQ